MLSLDIPSKIFGHVNFLKIKGIYIYFVII
jgi:hypothetical protein